MPPLPLFCGPTYQAISPNIDAEDAINLYCEQSESPGAKTPLALIMAPGKRLFSQLPEAAISGLDISTISLFPDNIVSFISDHREIGFLSSKKSVAYYHAGAGFPPFIPIQGSFAEYGAGAMSATVQADNAIFWIDADERGQAVA